jgi:hypothetical protein
MKNIILITFVFFIYSCGYTSVYKNLGKQDFQMIITEMQGDRDMNNLIKNEINLYSNDKSINIFNIKIETEFEKLVLTKNSTGLITDYELSANSTFTIYFDDKAEKIILNETINIKSRTDTFEQDLYEQNIKRNFASSMRERLVSEILTLK